MPTTHRPPAPAFPPPIPAVSHGRQRSIGVLSGVFALSVFAVMLLFLCTKLARWFGELGLSVWVALPLAVIASLLLLFTLMIGSSLLTREGRQTLRDLGTDLSESGRGLRMVALLAFLRSEKRDLARADRSAGSAGRTTRKERILVWSDAPIPVETEVFEKYEQVRAAFESLMGSPIQTKRALRCFIFEGEAGFRSYLGPALQPAARISGCYSHFLNSRVLVSRADEAVYPSWWRNALAHELAHHFQSSCLKTPEPWLEEGLARFLEKTTTPPPIFYAPGASARILRVMRARGSLFTGEALVRMDAGDLEKLGRNWRDAESNARHSAFYSQSGGLFDWLWHKHPEGLRKKLRGEHAKRDDPVKSFLACFGMSPDEAVRQWLSDQPDYPPANEPPTPEVIEWIEQQLWPELDSSDPTALERLQAIRSLGSAGYAWRADRLIAIAQNPHDPLRDDAIRSLEFISGQPQHAISNGWAGWFVSMPVEVVGPEFGSSLPVTESAPPIIESVSAPPLLAASARASSRGLWIGFASLVGVSMLIVSGIAWHTWQQVKRQLFIVVPESVSTPVQKMSPVEARTPRADTPPSAERGLAEITHETRDMVVSGTGFSVRRFEDRGRAFANRRYVWQEVPEGFRGWHFTQVSGGRRAEIRVRAKTDTVVLAATALSQSSVGLTGWEIEGSGFRYSDAGKTPMTVIQRQLAAGEEIELPQGNWSGVILLLPN